MNKVLEIVVFVCGAVVMIFELTGARLLAPYCGTSFYIWTNIIGVILMSLSFGYYFGGKFSDTIKPQKLLKFVLITSGVLLCLLGLFNVLLFDFVARIFKDLRIQALVSSLFAFGPVSIFLGSVSPIAAKIRLVSLQKSGSVFGNLNALSTLGSIVGTFSAGYFLIPSIGNQKILYFLSALIFLISLPVFLQNKNSSKTPYTLILIFLAINIYQSCKAKPLNYQDIDTLYNRILVYNSKDVETGEEIKIMQINNRINSAIFMHSAELVYPYSKAYLQICQYYKPQCNNALFIGGGAYTVPHHFLAQYPSTNIDVVEIDGAMKNIAERYFNYKNHPQINCITADGRNFLNNTHSTYEVVFWDAFSSELSVPYQLTTVECFKQLKQKMQPNGLLLMNIVSSLDDKYSHFLSSQIKTLKTVFKQVELFPVQNSKDKKMVQNVLILAGDNLIEGEKNQNPEAYSYTDHKYTKKIKEGIILTDDYAPANYLMYK